MSTARFPVAALLGIVACSSGSPTSPGAPVGSEFTMRPGQTTVIQGSDNYLGFQTVVTDSRCPLDVLCIQPGEAVVRVGLSSGATTTIQELSTRATQAFPWGSFLIHLVRLDPYPATAVPIALEDYRATFLVTLR